VKSPRALNEQNAQFAAGKIGQSPTGGGQEMVYTITTKGRLSTVDEFENIILRANADGSKLRLRDVARVELGQGLRLQRHLSTASPRR
jgi:multidrug efflux pump